MMRYLVSLFSNMSDMRRRYAFRLAGRCAILVIAVLLCIFDPAEFEVLRGWNFFRRFSWLHLLWVIWIIDMAAQILPLRTRISLGSQKMWHMRFKPIREMFNARGKLVAEGVAKLKKHVADASRSALWVLILWMIFAFRRTDPWAAWLQIPYLLWVTFAAYLNWGVWVLN